MAEENGEDGFVLFPSTSGGGVLARRSQIAGARPNGQEGAIIYLESGPSLYSSITTPEIARFLEADMVAKR